MVLTVRLFLQALAQYGENYELIAYVMPGRDRKSCKNKFKAEDKKNPARINYCLNNRTAPGKWQHSPAHILTPGLIAPFRYCLALKNDRKGFFWTHARDSRP